VIETQQPVVVADTAAETRWPRLMAEIRRQGIASFCCVPLTTARRGLGTLGFGLRSHIAYRAGDVAFMGQVAKLVAVAVENALNFDDAQAMQGELSAERDHQRLLLEVTNALVSKLDLLELITAISSSLQRAIPHELISLDLPDNGDLVVRSVAFKTIDGKAQEGRRLSIDGSPPGRAFATRRTQVFGEEELLTRFPEVTEAVRERLKRVQDNAKDKHAPRLSDRLLEIGQDCAPRLKEPFRSADHGDLLYDEKGLPK